MPTSFEATAEPLQKPPRRVAFVFPGIRARMKRRIVSGGCMGTKKDNGKGVVAGKVEGYFVQGNTSQNTRTSFPVDEVSREMPSGTVRPVGRETMPLGKTGEPMGLRNISSESAEIFRNPGGVVRCHSLQEQPTTMQAVASENDLQHWHSVARKATEIAPKRTLAPATVKEYEQRAKRLHSPEGWDWSRACKRERYLMRAAGIHDYQQRIRAAKNQAERFLKNGVTGDELLSVRRAMWATQLHKVQALCNELQEFKSLVWMEIADPHQRQEGRHKKRPATDRQLVQFYERASRSSFFLHFLVAEFSGCRGQEFEAGIRCEVGQDAQGSFIVFSIESCKCDGKRKGLEVRRVLVRYPHNASKPVQERWEALMAGIAQQPNGVVSLAPTAHRTAGQRFTRLCADIAKACNLPISAYSFRQRFSAQAKASGDAVSVALALGHQSTETQRHYARRQRSSNQVSPVQIEGIAVDMTPRGPAKRQGIQPVISTLKHGRSNDCAYRPKN